jgi:recombination protein RecT
VNQKPTNNKPPVQPSKAVTTAATAIATLNTPNLIKALKAVLPKGMSVDRYLAIAVAEIKGVSLAKVTVPESIIVAVYHAAKLGLSLNPHMKEAYLVPFNDRKNNRCLAQFIPGFKGLQKLCRNAGMKDMSVTVVYSGDSFDWWEDETGTHYTLRPLNELDRGTIKAVVTRATLPDDTVSVKITPIDYLTKVMESALKKTNGTGPWKDWPEEMAAKTGIKYHCKSLPQSEQLASAIAADEVFEGAPIDSSVPSELSGAVDADYTDIVNQTNEASQKAPNKPVTEAPKPADATKAPYTSKDLFAQTIKNMAVERKIEAHIDAVCMAEYGEVLADIPESSFPAVISLFETLTLKEVRDHYGIK